MTFATIATSDHQFQEIENPRFLKQAQNEIASAQKAVSKKKRGSSNRTKAIQKLRKAHKKVSNQRKNFAHQKSAKMVNDFTLIGAEQLEIKKNDRIWRCL